MAAFSICSASHSAAFAETSAAARYRRMPISAKGTFLAQGLVPVSAAAFATIATAAVGTGLRNNTPSRSQVQEFLSAENFFHVQRGSFVGCRSLFKTQKGDTICWMV